MSGYAYIAKTPIPAPWPWGWPLPLTGYTLSVTIPADITAGAVVATEARILVSGVDTPLLAGHLITVQYTKASNGAIVQCKKLVGDSWADSIGYQAANYSAAKYGFSANVYVNTTGLEGEVLVCTCTITSPNLAGADAGTISGAPSSYTMLFGGYAGICLTGAYPTVDSEAAVVPTAGFGYVGKHYGSAAWGRRNRALLYQAVPSAIPASIVTATLSLSGTAKITSLEDFNNLKVYLASGSVPTVVANYDPSGLPLLATVASGNISAVTGTLTITLDATVLNANAGADLTLLLTTSVEEAGAGLDIASNYPNESVVRVGALSNHVFTVALTF